MVGVLIKNKDNRVTASLFGLLVLAFLVVFYPAWESLFRSWSSSKDYSHGFLIVPLSLYFVWDKRNALRATPVKPSWFGFPLVMVALFLYLIAQYAEVETLSSFSMILFLGSSLFFLFGGSIFKLCSFSFFLLLFMVPIPSQIYASLTIPLQLFVTKTTVMIASSMGIPILNEGNVIYLPEHTLQVVQACSGLRSIMSLMTLGVVIAYVSMRSIFLRSILVLFTFPIAIIVNVVRVLLMVFAFYFFGFDLSSGTIHTLLGILLFCSAILLFLLFRRGLVLCEK